MQKSTGPSIIILANTWFFLIALTAYSAAARCDDDFSSFDKAWSFATLYQNEENSLVQKFALSGRLQLDAAFFDADQGDFDDLKWRRFRFGFTTRVLEDFTVRIEGDFDLNNDGKYERLTDSYIGWSPTNRWEIRALKHSAGFTLDGATSSTKLLTPQRNNLTNNLWFDVEYFTGISIKGKTAGRWKYKTGLFSSHGGNELGHFTAGYFGLFSLAYDLSPALGFKNATLRLDYVNTDEHPGAAEMDQVISLVSEWEQHQWGLRTDISAGKGTADQSDLWGLVLMPFYKLDDRLQLVFRYTYIKSKDPNGVRLTRYEREITKARGDQYTEYFGGINVFLYGHKLKWQTGLEYANMKDEANDGGAYDGWGVSTVLRMYW
jgi:phosphate-selective porin OprO/OprP